MYGTTLINTELRIYKYIHEFFNAYVTRFAEKGLVRANTNI